MTNQHSTTGERERIARAAWILMCSSQAEFFEDPNGWWTFALKAASEMPNGPHADLVDRCRVFADAILSRPSRRAASSEGETLAKKWEAECGRTPYEPGKECTGRRVALTQCARELRAMLAARPDAGTDIEVIKRDAYKQGWNDREGDLLVAMDRIYPASTPPVAVPVSEEMVEAAAREFSGAPFPSHRSITRARAALTAALAVPDKGVQG